MVEVVVPCGKSKEIDRGHFEVDEPCMRELAEIRLPTVDKVITIFLSFSCIPLLPYHSLEREFSGGLGMRCVHR